MRFTRRLVLVLLTFAAPNLSAQTDIPPTRVGNVFRAWLDAFNSGDSTKILDWYRPNTLSGAEEFTYNLKTQKRATIIGETTGGGAHPVSGRRADDHFVIALPGARAINPITHTNWEGTGIEPDVKVTAAEALATAQKLIRERPRT
jgi:hypothetical protein